MMKKLFVVAFFILTAIQSFSQILFERGYFIDNAGIRTECLIKNLEWKNNPDKFQYKSEGSETINTKEISALQEFGMYEQSTYVVRTVDIDRSELDHTRLSTIRKPEFVRQQLTLKVLVEGPATLYYYEENNLSRYFFRVSDSIQQLVFKKYLVNNRGIAENKLYHQQLIAEVNCTKNTQQEITRINYRRSDLVKYFKEHNHCVNGEDIVLEKPKRKNISLKLTPGMAISTLKIENQERSWLYNVSFENKVSYRLGVEAEIFLPFNKSKWSVLIEPSYHSLVAEEPEKNNIKREVDLKFLEIAIGSRYGFFVKENTRIFVNAIVLANFPMNSTIKYNNLEPSFNYTVALGTGISYKRVSAEVRYAPAFDMLTYYRAWNAKYARTMFIVGLKMY